MITQINSVNLSPNIDIDDLQSQLNAKIGSGKNDFQKNEWSFVKQNGITKLDFNALKGLANNSSYWKDKVDELIFSIKLLWLESTVKCVSISGYNNKYKGLCLLASFLIESDQSEIHKDNLYELLEFFLMNTWQKGGNHKILSPKTCSAFRAQDTSDTWQVSQFKNNLSVSFDKAITAKSIKQNLTAILESLSGEELTYRDWTEGGTFNFLTLDQGKYYIEHCADFFNNNIIMATATNAVLRESSEIVSSLGWTISSTTISYVSLALLGVPPKDIAKGRKINLLKAEELTSKIQQVYADTYGSLYVEKQLIIDEIIVSISKELKLRKVTQLTKDKIRFCVANRESTQLNKWLYDLNPDVSLQSFKSIIKSQIGKIKKSKIVYPDKKFLDGIGVKSKKQNNTLLKRYTTMVRNAGITSVVALLGWRESEFGFPLSAIDIFDNKDFLDQSYMPLRYNVSWLIPKTNGTTKLNREITYSANKLLKKLALLNNSNMDKPCIYSVTENKQDIYQSNVPIAAAIPFMWEHFVRNYPPFKKLQLLEQIKNLETKLVNGECLTNEEATTLKCNSKGKDVKNYAYLLKDKNLVTTWKKVNKEFDKVNFFLTPSGTKLKIGWLYAYKTRTLPANILIMIDEALSEETKHAINLITNKSQITGTYTQQVMSELVTDCIYPTPHALRHMWAEAVYRRFDGDAGWMIRSQFKHISSSMWLAYIKNKDNRRLHDKVKVKVISSLLKNYLMKNSEGYSGKLHVFLRRLYKNTVISTLDDFDRKIEEFAKFEFKDIKSNPWGYCILKTRQPHTAKCAQGGIPQRQNASPKLCLGCTNNLTQTTNLEHIVLNLSNDIDIVKKNSLPEAYVNSSYETLRNARNHIKDLDPTSKYLSKIDSVIEQHRIRLRG